MRPNPFIRFFTAPVDGAAAPAGAPAMPTPADVAARIGQQQRDPAAQPTGDAQAPAGTTPPADTQANPADAPSGDTTGQGETFARSYVEALRRENAAYRTRVDEAAQNARDEVTQAIGKALGLITEDATPEQLAQQAQTERDTLAKQATTAAETAVLRAAAPLGLTLDAADRLLDSRRFTTALDKLDTAADDYAAQVTASSTHPRRTPRRRRPPPAPSTPAPGPSPTPKASKPHERDTTPGKDQRATLDRNREGLWNGQQL